MTMHYVEKPHLGFIGMGHMGTLMTQQLLRAGYRVTVYDRTPARTREVATSGAQVADTPRELAQDAECILSCVTNYEALIDLMEGPKGAIMGARNNTTFIDLSTISPLQSRAFADKVHEYLTHAQVLDAAVSGSTPQAANGELVIFVGGDKQTFQENKAILEPLSRSIFYMGEQGKGTCMKMVVNTLLGLEMQAIAEAIALGEKAGIHRELLADVLSQTTVIAPAHKAKLENYKKDVYDVNFALSLMHKDFGLIHDLATTLNVAMPATAAAEQMYSAALATGGDDDFSVMIRAMCKLARAQPEH